MDGTGPFLLFGLFVAAAIVFAVLWARAEAKRRAAMAVLAERLGFEYHASDPFGLHLRYGFFEPLAKGENRYAYNILSGNRPPLGVLAFDFHYETHSTDSKGRRHTHHHHATHLVVDHPYDLGRLSVRPETLFDKVADAVGFDDIDFESAEFSKRYWVKAQDKKLAYDLLNPQAIEFLLKQPKVGLLCEGLSTLVSFGPRRCDPEEIEALLRIAKGFHELVPPFVKADRALAAGGRP